MPHPQIWGQYMGKILVPIDNPHWYFMDAVRSISATSRRYFYRNTVSR